MSISTSGGKIRISCLLIALWIGALLIGAGFLSESVGRTIPVDRERLVQSNNAFSLALLRQLNDHSGNLVISPYGVSMAMAVPYAGARNDTETQMAETLHFTLQQDQLHAAFNAMMQWDKAGEEKGYSFRIANALWAQKGVDFEKRFLDIARRYHEAGLYEMDFTGSAEKARTEINRWIENHTNSRVEELLEQGHLNAETGLVITNALQFKGLWKFPFKADDTLEQPFHLDDGEIVGIPMMSGSGRFAMAFEENTTILELPYDGDRLSMVLVLPKEMDGLAALQSELDQDRIVQWLDGLQEQDVYVRLPRFTLDTRVDLTNTLSAMGMPDAFDNKADFSGIAAKEDLFISLVMHQASIEVDEEGTEATAASAVVMKRKGGAHFNANHPFLFLIRDMHTGSMPFIGRVLDPSTR